MSETNNTAAAASGGKKWGKKEKFAAGAAAIVVLFLFLSYRHNHPSANDVAEAQAPAQSNADTLRQEANSYYQSFEAAVAPCDQASQKARATTTGTDLVAVYDALTEAQKTCHNVFMAVTNLQMPQSAEGDQKKAFSDARDTCQVAFSQKSDAYAAAAKVINGDMSPAAQSAARQTSDDADQSLTACVAQMMTAVDKSGGDTPLKK